MHVVMRTEQSVPEKSITGTPLRTASSSRDFECERTVATQHHVAQCSGYKVVSGPRTHWLRSIVLHSAVATERTVATEQARAVISSAQWLLSKLEQWFRPHSGDRTSSSSHFERTVATEQARAAISSARWLLSKFEQ